MIKKLLQTRPQTKLILALSFMLAGVSLFVRYTILFLQEGGQYKQEFVLVALILCVMMILWALMHQLRRLPIMILLILGPFLAIFMDSIHTELYFLINDGRFSWQDHDWSFTSYIYFAYLGSLVFFTWILGYLTIVNYFRYRNEILRLAQAQDDTNKAEFEILRYKLNPHFLFNTLNSISSLVLDNKNIEAENVIDHLSDFLRYTLDKTPETKITFDQEIKILKSYLDIEQVRFREKLITKYDFDPKTFSCLVPTLLMQPAIEFIIRNSVRSAQEPVTITISSKCKDDKVVLCVADDGKGLVSPDADHEGLCGIQTRLKSLYGNNALLDVLIDRPKGVQIYIFIPADCIPGRRGTHV